MFQFRRFPPYDYGFIIRSPILSRSGFPIRKSADRGLFAAPRGLSQLVTSFIGSWCQGIHLVLFLAWSLKLFSGSLSAWIICDTQKLQSFYHVTMMLFIFSFRFITIHSCYSIFKLRSSWNIDVSWWAQVDSNYRPRAYQARALTCWAMSPSLNNSVLLRPFELYCSSKIKQRYSWL